MSNEDTYVQCKKCLEWVRPAPLDWSLSETQDQYYKRLLNYVCTQCQVAAKLKEEAK